MGSQPGQLESSSNPGHPRDDAALVADIRAGRSAAWRELLSRHQDRLYTICLRMLGHHEDARECCQDALVKVVQSLDRFDGRSQFGTWAVRITMNTCVSAIRSRKLRRHRGLGGEVEPAIAGLGTRGSGNPRELTPDRGVQEDEQRAALRAAFSTLDDEQRAILLLRDVQGLDYDQIGQALDLPIGTVKSRIFRARAALRGRMEGDNRPRTLGAEADAGQGLDGTDE